MAGGGIPEEDQGRTGPEPPVRIWVVVTPDFNIAATMGFIDPFRAANYLEGRPLVRWRLLSQSGGPARASNGAVLETEPLPAAAEPVPDFLILSSSWDPEAYVTPALSATLRSMARKGVTLGALDTGAFILGHAGLLDGYRATVHYEHIDAFAELFPKAEVQETLWVFDGPRITCCGGAASGEFALHLLQALQGRALANAAARYLFAPGLRDRNAPQNPQEAEPLGVTVPDPLRRAIKLMEENLETPLTMAELGRRLRLSHRQVNRLFARYVGKAPSLYYREIRLDRARGLVTQTNLTMTEIAFACGFSSQAQLSRAYRERFGLPPSRDRIEGRIPFEFRAWPMHRNPS